METSAPRACLRVLVSASWAVRMTASPVLAGRSLGSPSIVTSQGASARGRCSSASSRSTSSIGGMSPRSVASARRVSSSPLRARPLARSTRSRASSERPPSISSRAPSRWTSWADSEWARMSWISRAMWARSASTRFCCRVIRVASRVRPVLTAAYMPTRPTIVHSCPAGRPWARMVTTIPVDAMAATGADRLNGCLAAANPVRANSTALAGRSGARAYSMTPVAAPAM